MSSFDRQLKRARDRQRPTPEPSLVAYALDAFDSPEQAALIAVRTQGCTCAPEIEIADDGIRVTARHDPWCALLRQQDQN